MPVVVSFYFDFHLACFSLAFGVRCWSAAVFSARGKGAHNRAIEDCLKLDDQTSPVSKPLAVSRSIYIYQFFVILDCWKLRLPQIIKTLKMPASRLSTMIRDKVTESSSIVISVIFWTCYVKFFNDNVPTSSRHLRYFVNFLLALRRCVECNLHQNSLHHFFRFWKFQNFDNFCKNIILVYNACRYEPQATPQRRVNNAKQSSSHAYLQ